VPSTERIFYFLTICVLGAALAVTTFLGRQRPSTVAITHLEIQDTSGHTRIFQGTDADGTAEMRFVDATGKKVSRIEQYRDGSTSLRFDGTGDGPSITIEAMQQGPSPMIVLAGNSDDQRIY
jgi:hypothetical protein